MDAAQPLWLIGASGQVGRFVAERLATAGRPFRAVTGSTPAPPGSRAAAWLVGDAADMTERFAATRAEAAILTLGLWTVPPLLAPLAAGGVRRIVAVGSMARHYRPGYSAATDRLRTQLIEAVARIETQARDLGLAVAIMQPTEIYGGGRRSAIAQAARLIRRWGVFPVARRAEGLRQPVHADDIAATSIAAVDRVAPGVRSYPLGGSERLAFSEMIGRIFDALGRPRRLARLPAPVLAAATACLRLGDPGGVRRQADDLTADNAAAAAAFGHAPCAFLPAGAGDLGLD
ncbi:MAG: NAD-dependent dehydratase [Alphaproteobacteria bacterium]|nr:NAD-dependent dehydratase [Alphaproteobacteria bacterium]